MTTAATTMVRKPGRQHVNTALKHQEETGAFLQPQPHPAQRRVHIYIYIYIYTYIHTYIQLYAYIYIYIERERDKERERERDTIVESKTPSAPPEAAARGEEEAPAREAPVGHVQDRQGAHDST